MKKIHPIIKKFWEDQGYTISNEDQTLSATVTANKMTWPLFTEETIAYGDQYRYENKWYSEKEMLKIIELTAFI
jgi:uncharacterized lipoprotein